jgi:hypothetical protein
MKVRNVVLHPPRQSVVRLTREQCDDLRYALKPHHLLPDLVRTIEDQLYVYERNHRSFVEAKQFVKRLKPIEKQAGKLLQLLTATNIDPGLEAILESRLKFWRSAPPLERHREADSEMSWRALEIVTVLDRHGVGLDVGRDTTSHVVRVLRLFREWAADRRGRQRARDGYTSADYLFARVIVDTYRENQAIYSQASILRTIRARRRLPK